MIADLFKVYMCIKNELMKSNKSYLKNQTKNTDLAAAGSVFYYDYRRLA
ncbi:MAG: hypothetical protein A4E59_02000 [Syntrophorhabdus sp. PtaB.Bin027]|nr:MAG: hypothetical protein A4E59_02000 [Syntrophorhabdus sp. PtaB.Bin027]OQB76135.1 MAG: hypothetical protein BWX92_02050 [Deltaproteobacteria bacterium ADurb.Bin135]